MSRFADIIFDVQNVSLNKIYTETNREEKKMRILKQYKKKYWDDIFNETEKIFKQIVSKNYKKERKFFDQVRQIKEKGIDFFEKLLDCDIPKRYNTLFFSQIVMNKDEIYNCQTEFIENWNGSFCLRIKKPYFVIKEYNKENELKCEIFDELTFRLECDQPSDFNLGFNGDSSKHTEEDFWKLYNVEKAYVEFSIFEHYDYYMNELKLENILLN